MFKRGQVIRNKHSGYFAVIRESGIEVLTGPIAGTCIPSYSHESIDDVLIGNNYQERQTKQAQPGTAFKRWLGELTSAIPEQRGCRKEDC